MGKNMVELGLNRPEVSAEAPDTPEAKVERPNFSEAGAQRLGRAKEKFSKIGGGIKRGVIGFMNRIAATPEIASYVAKLGNEKSIELHQKAGEVKDSVVDAIESRIVQGGEYVEKTAEKAKSWTKDQYQDVRGRAVAGYKSLEARAVSAYDRYQNKMQEREFQEAQADLRRAQERYEKIARELRIAA